MGTLIWTKRFLLAFAVAGLLLFGVGLIKGHGQARAIEFALLWGALTGAVYAIAGYIRYRRNPACMTPRRS